MGLGVVAAAGRWRGDSLGYHERTEALVSPGCGSPTIPDCPHQTGGLLNREEGETTRNVAGQEAFVLWRDRRCPREAECHSLSPDYFRSAVVCQCKRCLGTSGGFSQACIPGHDHQMLWVIMCLRQVGEDNQVQLSSSERPGGQKPDFLTDPQGWGGGEQSGTCLPLWIR